MSKHLNRKNILAAVTVVLLALAAVRIWAAASHPAVAAADTRTLMDAETGRLATVNVTDGFGPFPMVNPRTGERTLYPTEICYANGCAAKGGTHVILNSYLGKEGPTYCPACGGEVRFHNPGPGASSTGGW